MKLTGNTILITGGGSGIGRGLAEAFHKLGNQVIISGRRKSHLDATTRANPGMASVELDVTNTENIAAVTKQLVAQYPGLNVLINNAGVMLLDEAAGVIDDDIAATTVATNLLGPVRMSSALLTHLKAHPSAAIINISSVLGYVPLARTAVYSATKAAIHSYTLSQRHQLRGSSVAVLEIAPPWVRTELLNSSDKEAAMPLAQFIEETMATLGTGAEEILVEQAKPIRANPGLGEHAFVTQFNDMMANVPLG